MKLTTITFVSVDWIVQGIGGPDEDRSAGSELGGWTTPLWDAEAGAFLKALYARADAFLFGRRTYEIPVAFDPGERRITRQQHPPDALAA